MTNLIQQYFTAVVHKTLAKFQVFATVVCNYKFPFRPFLYSGFCEQMFKVIFYKEFWHACTNILYGYDSSDNLRMCQILKIIDRQIKGKCRKADRKTTAKNCVEMWMLCLLYIFSASVGKYSSKVHSFFFFLLTYA